MAGCSRRSNFQNGSSSIKQVLLSPYVHPKRSANPSQNVRRIPSSVGCRKDRRIVSPFVFPGKSIHDPEGLARFAFFVSVITSITSSFRPRNTRIMRHRVMIARGKVEVFSLSVDELLLEFVWVSLISFQVYCLYFFVD